MTTCCLALPARDLQSFAFTTWPCTTTTPSLIDARPAHASKNSEDACNTWSRGTSMPPSCPRWMMISPTSSTGITNLRAACTMGKSQFLVGSCGEDLKTTPAWAMPNNGSTTTVLSVVWSRSSRRLASSHRTRRDVHRPRHDGSSSSSLEAATIEATSTSQT